MLDLEPITYREASELLGIPMVTLRNAACRDTITRLPSLTLDRKVLRGQVLLFKDKKQLRKSQLSEIELGLWAQYAAYVHAPYRQESAAAPAPASAPSFNMDVSDLLKALAEQKYSLNFSPSPAPGSFPSFPLAQAGENKGSLGEMLLTLGVLLFALFMLMRSNKLSQAEVEQAQGLITADNTQETIQQLESFIRQHAA